MLKLLLKAWCWGWENLEILVTIEYMNSEPSCRGWVSHLCLFWFLTWGSLNYVRITLADDEIVWNCAYGYPKKWCWQRTFQGKTPWCWAGSAFQAGLHHITSYYTNITSILWKIKAKYPKNNHVTMILIVSCLTFSASCVLVPLLAAGGSLGGQGHQEQDCRA